jgi:OTU domain-containing protein 6
VIDAPLTSVGWYATDERSQIVSRTFFFESAWRTGSKCAQVLEAHEHDFSPFCELSDSVPDYETYVDRVRSSADWGGHLELRALSIALKRPVVVYSAQSPEPLRIEEQQREGESEFSSSGDDDNDDPIRLSYHRSYYALGEHYNQVVPVPAAAAD